MNRPCDTYKVTRDYTNSGERVGERFAEDVKMVRSLISGFPTRNTRVVEYANEVAQKEEGGCGQEWLRNKSLSARLSFL